MADWYYQRLLIDRRIDIPKAEGGMAGGSLYRAIEKMHFEKGVRLKANLSNVDETLLHEAIKQRVRYRLAIFESIRQKGFCFTWDFVGVVSKDNLWYLNDGHHRVASLAICGENQVMCTVSESVYLRLLRKSAIELLGPIIDSP